MRGRQIGVWKLTLAALDRLEVVDERLNGAEPWICSIPIGQLARQGFGHTGCFSDALPSGVPRVLQSLHELVEDWRGAHARILSHP